jgi:hypothetical protein
MLLFGNPAWLNRTVLNDCLLETTRLMQLLQFVQMFLHDPF